VTIPASVTSIWNFAFSECFPGCAKLTSVVISAGGNSIRKNAFQNCSVLTNVTISSTVTGIGSSAFQNCTGLTSVEFLGNAPTMGTSVFDSAASGFTVKYHGRTSGFTSPTWNGYAAMNIDPGTLYAAWQESKFLADDITTGLTTMTADFDSDGIANLLEYGFGADPKASEASPVVLNGDGSSLQVSFPCDASCTDISYTVQSSSSLSPNSWNDIARSVGGAATVPVGSLSTVSDPGTGLRTVTVTDSTSLPANGQRFLRVKVTVP